MATMNQIVLIGRVGNHLSEDLRIISEDSQVLEVRLAVDRKTKTRDGETITDWISCQFWNRQAEVLVAYVKRGELISVTGSLRVDTWKKDGQTRMKYYIAGERFQMLSARKESAPPKKVVRRKKAVKQAA